MTEIKICGMMSEEDVDNVNILLPEYVGFIFAPSRRRRTAEEARKLVSKLDKTIKTVGVFVNESIETVVKTAMFCELQVVQIHGDEPPEYLQQLRQALVQQRRAYPQKNEPFIERKVEIWRAIRVKNQDSLKVMEQANADSFVLDAYVEGSYGGAGRQFDWELAAQAAKYKKIILAGGLTAENVSEAVRIVKPFAVDVSSGVETDGKKDRAKMMKFIIAARRTGGEGNEG